jgi:hypothetical protein
MGTNKLLEKLEDFFDLTEKKQRNKHHRLVKIIHELEEKQARLEQKAKVERKNDASSGRYKDLERELVVISGLICKAKKKSLAH